MGHTRPTYRRVNLAASRTLAGALNLYWSKPGSVQLVEDQILQRGLRGGPRSGHDVRTHAERGYEEEEEEEEEYAVDNIGRGISTESSKGGSSTDGYDARKIMLIASGSAWHSCSKTRAANVSAVSSGFTGHLRCKITGPLSYWLST